MAYTLTVTPSASSSMVLRFLEINSVGTRVQDLAAVSSGLVASLGISPSTPTPGNLLIVSVVMNNGTTPGATVSICSDTINTWSQAVASGTTRKATNEQWYTRQGGATGGPDASSGNNGSSTAATSGTSAASTQAVEFVLGTHSYAGASSVTDTGLTAGFTAETQQTSTGGTPINEQSGWQLSSSTGTWVFAGTLSSTESWGATVCTYKLPVSASSRAPVFLRPSVFGPGGAFFFPQRDATVFVPGPLAPPTRKPVEQPYEFMYHDRYQTRLRRRDRRDVYPRRATLPPQPPAPPTRKPIEQPYEWLYHDGLQVRIHRRDRRDVYPRRPTNATIPIQQKPFTHRPSEPMLQLYHDRFQTRLRRRDRFDVYPRSRRLPISSNAILNSNFFIFM